MPCYELVYEADYRLEDLVRPTSSARLSKGAEAYACTGFSARLPEGQPLYGRNFDWHPNPALVLMTRPKGRYASISLVDNSYLGYSATRTPMEAPQDLEGAWRLPFDGMNEKGLVVGMMAVDHAEGPKGAGKPRIGELGILRVLLDRAATVRDAITLMGEYEIDLANPPIHYLLADRSGDAAIVEFTGGKLHVFRTGKPWAVSTNFLLGEVPPPARDRACWRFAKVSDRLGQSNGVLDRKGVLDLLEAVSVPRTRWSAVYEPDSLTLTLVLVRRFRQPHRWCLETKTSP